VERRRYRMNGSYNLPSTPVRRVLPAPNEFPNPGIIGPTVEYKWEWGTSRAEADVPCHMKGVLVAASCLDCPLSVCRYDNLKQANAEVLDLINKGELWLSTELSEDQ